jgi:hypothetical protein
MTILDLSQFKCLGCGACCRQEGYVRLKKNEPDTIASFLNMDVYQFIETFTILNSIFKITHGQECSIRFACITFVRTHNRKGMLGMLAVQSATGKILF